jgi:hypothetical protein
VNVHKKLSIMFLRHNQPDALAVFVPNKSKAPNVKTDFSGADAIIKSQNNIKELEKPDSSYQPGAVLRGRWVDVDLDEVNPVLEECLSRFLNTPFIFGRKSKPRSHFFVRLSDEFDRHDRRFLFMSSVRALGLNMEIRGHKENNELHTNLPGGQHESGESVTWFNPAKVEEHLSVTPPLVGIDDFARSLRKAIVTAKVVGYWHSGQRHELALGIAGLLAKNYKAMMEDAGDPDMMKIVLDQNDCDQIIRAICEIAGDEEVEDRIAAIRGTWKKDNTDNIAGYHKLVAIMGEEDARLLRVSLAGSPFMDRLEELNELVAYYAPEGAFIILSDVPKYGPVLRQPAQYQAHLPNHEVELPAGDKSKFLHASKALRRFEMTRNVSRFEMIPDKPVLVPDTLVRGDFILNTFKRWYYDVHAAPVSSDDPDIKPILDHVHNVVSGGDVKVAHWILSWFADIYQDPTNKPGTALILVGAQGAGKSTLSGLLGGALGAPMDVRNAFPGTFFSFTDKIDQLVGKFNEHLEGKLLIQLEEVIQNAGSKGRDNLQNASILKSLITKQYDLVEPKGHKIREVKNVARYIFTSNSVDRAQRIEQGDRRYSVVEVSSDKKDDFDYWSDLFNRGVDPKIQSKMFRYLKDYKYDKDFIRRPVSTKARQRMQLVTLSREESEVQVNFVSWLVKREANPLYEDLQEAHWEATTNPVLEYYNNVWSAALWRESWPAKISPDYWERCFYRFAREEMHINSTFAAGDVHFLASHFESAQTQNTVKWTTRDARGDRMQRRVRLRGMPTRRRMYEWLQIRRAMLDQEVREIEELIQMDEAYRFDRKNNNAESEF